jgi:F-type H+-transporting ATPase subunit beta
MKGKEVNLNDALDGCERILSDEFKDLPESAFYMIGTIDEAKKSGDGKPKPEVEKRTNDAKKDSTEAESKEKPEKVLETHTK